MQTEALTHYSPSLGRDMHMMVYGHGGTPFLVFPTQDGMCRQWEEFGLHPVVRRGHGGCGELVEQGR